MNAAKIEAVQRPLIVENNALRKRAEEAEARARQACQTLVAAFGSIGPENVEHAAERAAEVHAKTLTRVAELESQLSGVEGLERSDSVSGDDGGHIGAMPGYDPLTRSVRTETACPERYRTFVEDLASRAHGDDCDCDHGHAHALSARPRTS